MSDPKEAVPQRIGLIIPGTQGSFEKVYARERERGEVVDARLRDSVLDLFVIPFELIDKKIADYLVFTGSAPVIKDRGYLSMELNGNIRYAGREFSGLGRDSWVSLTLQIAALTPVFLEFEAAREYETSKDPYDFYIRIDGQDFINGPSYFIYPSQWPKKSKHLSLMIPPHMQNRTITAALFKPGHGEFPQPSPSWSFTAVRAYFLEKEL